MSEVIRGDTGELEDASFQSALDQEAEQWGEDDLDTDAVLEGLEEGDSSSGSEQGFEGESNAVSAMPTDEFMSWLDDNNPEGAATARAMQREMSRNINDTNALRSDILDVREQMLDYMGGENSSSGETDEEDALALPEGVTDEHVEMFNKLADHLGFVPKSALEAEGAEVAATDYTQSAMHEGVELYGDNFGTVDDDGEVTLNPEIQARLDKRLDSLQDPTRGVTPLDIFRLEFPGLGAPADSRSAGTTSQRRSSRPGVVRRTTGTGRSPVKIFDPAKNEDPSLILDRAWALAKSKYTR